MRVLVAGGYGLIGREIVRRLRADGHEVVGLGRDARSGRRADPAIAWVEADLRRMTDADAWAAHLSGVDAVVNASGALQDGPKDDLDAVQNRAIRALIVACERAGVGRFVQISAPGADPDADTAFLSTKGRADAALRGSTLDWAIFKPGLVIALDAYGGTALLRMLAAFPVVQPLALGDRRIQTVAASEVAEAVAWALTSPERLRFDADLVEPRPRPLREVVAAFRAWLGFSPARFEIAVPAAATRVLAAACDVAGALGWRSPLRTTAVRMTEREVLGDPEPWRSRSGRTPAALEQSLAALPATAQERLFAGIQLLGPLMLLILSMFWLASGVVGLARIDAAARELTGTALETVARPLAAGFAVADLLIGASMLARSWTVVAALSAATLSVVYLVAATVFTPWLWADPLGPLVKVLPAMVLALVVAAWARQR